MSTLEIKNLHVSIDNKQILKGLDLTIKSGEMHAIMGPNGSGKSTLSFAIMGHPKYTIDSGDILLDGQSILEMPTDKRAKAGLFLSFQYPSEIPGVGMTNFLMTAKNAMANGGPKASAGEFLKEMKEKMSMLKMDEAFIKRNVNEGFSGGEKKRAEILQMSVLKPKFAVLDEVDSGLDIDALKAVAEGINQTAKIGGGTDSQKTGVLMITHYQRILEYVKPHFVHIMMDGKIIKSGGFEIAEELESKGYEGYAPMQRINENNVSSNRREVSVGENLGSLSAR
ncbi:MAG: Fe-S cluster assembly ATPase SufC [Candidatus Aenigmarchaeota archaeon]|nr:Fe-S cluster assembly ATPase SufC [Candidatus Aenigmarchaeota archaeon]